MKAHIIHPSTNLRRALDARDLANRGIVSGRLLFVGAIILYRVVLDLCYVFYMNPVFANHFLAPMPIDFGPFHFILSYIFLVIPTTFVPYDKRDFSGIFFLIVLMFLYAPMTCMFGFDLNKSYSTLIMALISIIVSFFIAKADFSRVKLPIFRNGEKLSILISYLFVGYFILFSIFTGAILDVNLDISKVYEYRELSEGMLDFGIFSYLNLWTQKIFNPFLLAIGIYRKNRLMVIGAVAAQIFFFAVTQHRSHLFLPIIVYLASQLYLRKLSIAGLFAWSGVLLGFLLVVSVAADLQTIPALIIRRAFFVPSAITFEWVNFFSNLPKIYWSDGILRLFIHTRYSGESMPWYVGYYVSHGMQVAYNVGLVGTGYAQAGYFGVILYAAILGFVVKIVNTMIHSGLPAFLPAALLFGPIRTAWADADVLTAVLSHGILMGIIVMWLYGSQNARRSPPRGGRSAMSAAEPQIAPRPLSVIR